MKEIRQLLQNREGKDYMDMEVLHCTAYITAQQMDTLKVKGSERVRI